jgi:hypothetical protein
MDAKPTLGIDPGPEQSAAVIWAPLGPTAVSVSIHGLVENAQLARQLCSQDWPWVVACERIRSYGMPVGAETFETAEWCGSFRQAFGHPDRWRWIERREVKLHLCGSMRAKDANVRRALLDRFGGRVATRKGGPLYGVHGDLWSALAVAITAAETDEG